MSSRIKGITVEINADATKLSNALKEVEAKSKNLNSQGSPPAHAGNTKWFYL